MSLGIPALAIGLAQSNGVHSLNESVDVRELGKGLDLLTTLVAKRLQDDSAG